MTSGQFTTVSLWHQTSERSKNIPADTMSRTINVILLDPGTETAEFVEEQLKDQQLLRQYYLLNLAKKRVPDNNLGIV